jgi:hypothetical protein
MIEQVAPGVRLVSAENGAGTEIWSYVTDWGTIRDVYGFIGAMIARQFSIGTLRFDPAVVKAEGFTGLYLAMREYDGRQILLSYASYHIYKTIRRFLELWGEMRPGDTYGIMKVRGRVFTLRCQRREYPISRLAINPELLDIDPSMDMFADPGPQPDRSVFWERLEEKALTTGGKAARNLDALKAVVSGVPVREVACWHGVEQATINSATYNLRHRLARCWDAEEAWGLLG